MRLGPAALIALEKKIQNKVATKIGSKILAKVVAKALIGFFPLLGPLAAGIINYWILDKIHEDSIEFYKIKSKNACSSVK